ncbi:MAG: hypothetical protein U9N58_05205 [Thermodesulfobacteriota bacterium]|nr:hypothetical protein [Thermodesulfobacteriota bacterium]
MKDFKVIPFNIHNSLFDIRCSVTVHGGYNTRFTATHRTVGVYGVLQMRGGGCADVLPVLQVPGNKADAVPCERLRLNSM